MRGERQTGSLSAVTLVTIQARRAAAMFQRNAVIGRTTSASGNLWNPRVFDTLFRASSGRTG